MFMQCSALHNIALFSWLCQRNARSMQTTHRLFDSALGFGTKQCIIITVLLLNFRLNRFCMISTKS